MRSMHLWLLTLALLAGPACSRRPAETEEAVKQAVEKYLAARPGLNMQGMTVDVGGLRFYDDKAETDVVFRARSDSKATMSIHYTLRRQGSDWEVIPNSAAHAGARPLARSEGSPELPPGHPSVGSAENPVLPPGHPPVKSQ